MTLDELLERLKGHEWNDIEFKRVSWTVPKSAYETVSAFSNTAGGWLVFGVEKSDGSFEIVGVIEADQVQNQFLSTLRSRSKFNRVIQVQENLLALDDAKTVLVFYIPEVHRRDKPIFLDNDIRLSYVRSGGGDFKCSEDEVKRFLLDASNERYDEQPVAGLDPTQCFDAPALRWYREQFNTRNSGRDPSISDLDFLREWGLVIEKDGKLLPTVASILLFGAQSALLQVLPRPVADCQWINANRAEGLPEERWADRLVIETNLVQAWRSLVNEFLKHAAKPFAIQPDTLQREDTPPDYVAFREAAMNLLIHQDYADHSRKGLIQFFRDATVLSNPGDAFISSDKLLDPGDKEVRNPRIVNAFRRIGLSEAAGTGVRSIFRSWQQLGLVPPIIDNDRANKSFTLILTREELLSEAQILFEANLGVHLTDPEAATFAYLCRQKRLHVVDVKTVTGLAEPNALEVLNKLMIQNLAERVDAIPMPYYRLSPHLRELLEPGGAASAAMLHELSETQRKIIQVTDTPRSPRFLMELVSIKSSKRAAFVQNELQPLVNNHILQLTRPEQPDYRFQKYVLTTVGLKLKNRQRGPA